MRSRSAFKVTAIAAFVLSTLPCLALDMREMKEEFWSDINDENINFHLNTNTRLYIDRSTLGSLQVGKINPIDNFDSAEVRLSNSKLSSLTVFTQSSVYGDNVEIGMLNLNGGKAIFTDTKITEANLLADSDELFGSNLQFDKFTVANGAKARLTNASFLDELNIENGGGISLTGLNNESIKGNIRFQTDGTSLGLYSSRMQFTLVTDGSGGIGRGSIFVGASTLFAPVTNSNILMVKSGDKVGFNLASSNVYGDITAEQGGIADVLVSYSFLHGLLSNVNNLDVVGRYSKVEMTGNSDVAALNMGNSGNLAGGSIQLSGNIADDNAFYTLTAGKLTGSGRFIMRTDVANDQADVLNITGEATGIHLLYVTNIGSEPGRPGYLLPLVNIGRGDADFALADGRVDVGAWQYALVREGNTWGLVRPGVTEPPIKPVEPENPGDGGDSGNPGNPGDGGNAGGELPEGPSTSPSTDAVLSLASALKEMYFGELRSLNACGKRVNSGFNDGVWGSYTNNNVNVEGAWNSSYKLNQNGFLLGADHQYSFDAGALTAGLFVSNSTGSVKHARGGKSKIDTWGTGLYANYDFNNGWYANAVAKVNRFESSLSAKMTDGNGVSGDWTTWGYGAGAEVGRNIVMQNGLALSPYVALNGYQNEKESVQLSNGLKADFGNSRSLRGEVGVRAEKTLSVGKSDVTPYVSAAVVQEFARSSDVRINDSWNFKNDFTGTGGKVAAGTAVQLNGNTNLWIEAASGVAEKTTMPIQASAGIRVSF